MLESCRNRKWGYIALLGAFVAHLGIFIGICAYV